MEEDMKNLIESQIYFGLAMQDNSLEQIIRRFYFYQTKQTVDEVMALLPEKHPARAYYNKVSNETYSESQLTVFAKMAMWGIAENENNWDFISSEEDVDNLVEEIYNMDIHDIENFIKDNEHILANEDLEKYQFYFSILYIYLLDKEENANNIDYLKKAVDLLEKYNFNSFISNTDDLAIDEKYNYLLNPYDFLTWNLAKNGQYDLAEEYYKKYIKLLEEYIRINPSSYEARKYLSKEYSDYAYILCDIADGRNERSDELTYKSIETREKLVEEYPDKKPYLYDCLAINYNNIAYEYKKAYNKENNEEYKEKYYELYKKSIHYREELKKIDDFTDINAKIKNYHDLGRMYYFLFEDDKAKENFNMALEICKTDKNSDPKWIEKIADGLSKLEI